MTTIHPRTTDVDEADHALELTTLGRELMQRITAHVAATAGISADGQAVDRTWQIIDSMLTPAIPVVVRHGGQPAATRNVRRIRRLLKVMGIAIDK